MTETEFRRLAAWAALVSGVSALIDIVFSILAADGQTGIGQHLITLLRSGSTHATEMRIAWVADIFAYLALAPVFLYIAGLMLRRIPRWAALFSVCGLLYVAIGSIGATILAVVIPHLMRDYASAPPTHLPAIETFFTTMYRVVVEGLWDVLETIPGGIFWLGTGIVLLKGNRLVGWYSVGLGVLALLSSLGNILELTFVSTTGLGELWALVGTGWLFLLSYVLFRGPITVADPEREGEESGLSALLGHNA